MNKRDLPKKRIGPLFFSFFFFLVEKEDPLKNDERKEIRLNEKEKTNHRGSNRGAAGSFAICYATLNDI